MCKDTPLSMALTWAGMSSGPSTSCTQPALAGARRRSAVTKSARTSGSAFSWMTSEAVPQINHNRAVMRADLLEKAGHLRSDLEKTFAGGFHRQTRGGNAIGFRTANGGKLAQDRSALVEDLLLRARDGIDKTLPDVTDKSERSIEIGVARQTQRQVILRRRIGRHTGRQWQTARKQFFLQCRILALQSRDLILEYGPVLRRRLAGPADRLFVAQRHRP